MKTKANHPLSGSSEQRVPGAVWLLFAVFGAPVAWSLQLVAGYPFAAYPCFPHGAARTMILPGWSGARGWLIAGTVLAIAIGIAALIASWTAMARARELRREDSASSHRITRTRSLALAGFISGTMFVVAMLFTLATLVSLPYCSG